MWLTKEVKMGRLPDMEGALLFLGLICAVGGWAIIETLLWLFSFIHLSFG